MNCKICFEDYEVDKNNYIIENGKKTDKQIIICPECGGILCSDCMVEGFKTNKIFKCLFPKCEYIYDVIFIYTHFNKEQIKDLEEIFKNDFLRSEKQIIDTSFNIKYRIAGNLNKIFSIILESCRSNKDGIDIVEKVGEIVNDDDQNRYRELLKTMPEKDLKVIINEDKKLIEILKEEVKNKIRTMFETITYFINNETVEVNSENSMFNESAIDMVYDWYPNLITVLNKDEFLHTFRCFYTFMKYFYRKNNNGVNPMVEVFLFISVLYEKIDKTQNKYLYYLKHFMDNENNDVERNGYEIQGQYNTIYNGKFLRDNPEYYIINKDMLFRKYELFPNHKNIDWNILNCIKILFYYIDVSSLNIKAMLKQQKYMTCKNKDCDGNCYKYHEQIRCDKCNSIFCEKCFNFIYPEYINVLDGTVIKKVKNPDYNKYTEKQKNHKCKKEDLETVKLIRQNAKNCPVCNELVYKDGGCNDMFCYNCWLNGKHTLFKWDTMQLTKTTTNELFNHLMVTNKQQQPRFDHPDAQRLRARGATIEDIIKEYYKDKQYKSLLDDINNIISIPTITYNDKFLFEERIKFMFNFSSEDVELQKYHTYQSIKTFNMNEVYKFEPIKTIPKFNNSCMNIINMEISKKKELIENRFKQFIFNEYVKKSFIQYYSQLLASLKENIKDIIYTIKEDDFDKKQLPLPSYISNIKKLINTFNSQVSILKSSYSNLDYCNSIDFYY